ncbi:MAG: hypothetical protein VB957_04825 [Pseudomonadales bacterium]|jgi:tRNA (pseudouridine54-N1)-methyltransferase
MTCEFIIRARKAPVDADLFMASVGQGAHVEYLAQIFLNALFVSKGHRHDTTLTLVLEHSSDYSRAITIAGNNIGSLAGQTEHGLLQVIESALRAGKGLSKEETVVCDNGVAVTAISFERLVSSRAEENSVYMLDRKGTDIRDSMPMEDPVFLLTDHIPMPKKTFKSLARQGVGKISLGPVMLHASQCISVIHNELDRLG